VVDVAFDLNIGVQVIGFELGDWVADTNDPAIIWTPGAGDLIPVGHDAHGQPADGAPVWAGFRGRIGAVNETNQYLEQVDLRFLPLKDDHQWQEDLVNAIQVLASAAGKIPADATVGEGPIGFGGRAAAAIAPSVFPWSPPPSLVGADTTVAP
jgi:hypothetical protein